MRFALLWSFNTSNVRLFVLMFPNDISRDFWPTTCGRRAIHPPVSVTVCVSLYIFLLIYGKQAAPDLLILFHDQCTIEFRPSRLAMMYSESMNSCHGCFACVSYHVATSATPFLLCDCYVCCPTLIYCCSCAMFHSQLCRDLMAPNITHCKLILCDR